MQPNHKVWEKRERVQKSSLKISTFQYIIHKTKIQLMKSSKV